LRLRDRDRGLQRLLGCCGIVRVALLAVPHWFGRGSVSTSRSSNRTGRVSVMRRGLEGYAHRDVFVEGLVKAGVPE
jgi:hypothetical protein